MTAAALKSARHFLRFIAALPDNLTIRRVFMLVALLARSWVSIFAFICAAIARTQTDRYSGGKIVIHDGFERLSDRFFVRRRSVTKPSSVSNISLAIPLISIEAPYCLTQE
jgi:hypothetical protein